MVGCLRGEDGLLGRFLCEVRGMKKMLARLFPSVFGGVDAQVPMNPVVRREDGDENIMTHLGEVNGHPVAIYKRDGFQAHPDWIKSVEDDKARKKRGWFFHS